MATKQDILNLNIHKLTQDQYDEAFAAGKIDPNAIYLTPEEVVDLSGYATVEELGEVVEELDEAVDGATAAINNIISSKAGGTEVTLNGTSKKGTTASFYAPTDSGTDGYILKSGGVNANPSWIQNVPIANGGTGATSASGARTNLGVPPTSHATHTTTYGVSSAANYGHARASGTTPKANGTAAVGNETSSFARGDHVHPLQTTVSGNAGSASKVNNSLKIQLNGGTSEGSSQFTFNGSAAKTINITPANIGADPKGSINRTFSTAPIYSYSSGVLIDFNMNEKSGFMIVVKIYGHSYDKDKSPIEAIYQFYDLSGGAINDTYCGTAISGPSIPLRVYRISGKLKAWFQQPTSYCTFRVEVFYGNNSGGNIPNITLSNAVAPTQGISQTITITPKKVYAGASDMADNMLLTKSGLDIIATNNYIADRKLAIGSSSAPNENLYVNGTSKFSGAVTMNSTATIAGVTKITNDTDSSSSLNGALVVSGGIGVTKDIRVGGIVYVGASSTTATTNKLTINGQSQFNGNAAVTGTLNVTGATTLSNNLTVNGNTTLGNANTDTTTVQGSLIQKNGHIYLDGASTASSTTNTTQIIFRQGTVEHIALSSNGDCFVINPSSSTTANQIALYLGEKSTTNTSVLPSALSAAAFTTSGTLNVGSTSQFGNVITLHNSSDAAKQKITTTAGAMYISSASTLYLDSGSGSSLIFKPQGTEQARFNTSGKLELISGGKAAATITGPDTAGAFQFPNTGGTLVTHATRGTAVGSATTAPVYIASTGQATAITSVDVAHGGTGATTAAAARTKLGITPANIGAAALDENGKVLTSQLPSYVDDVIECATKNDFPTTGEPSKIYVDLSTNLAYRWGGTEYVEISQSLALGTTPQTAFQGDLGKIAYDYSQAIHAVGSYGICETAADVATKEIIIDDNSAPFILQPGAIITIKFSSTNSAASPKFKIGHKKSDGTITYSEEKSVFYNGSQITTTSTTFKFAGQGAKQLVYIYDGEKFIYIDSSNKTTLNPENGFLYAVASAIGEDNVIAITTGAHVTSFAFKQHGYVTIKFSFDVPAAAQLNINKTEAKRIYYQGKIIEDGIIHSGDIVTLSISRGYYTIVSIDKQAYRQLSTFTTNADLTWYTIAESPIGAKIGSVMGTFEVRAEGEESSSVSTFIAGISNSNYPSITQTSHSQTGIKGIRRVRVVYSSGLEENQAYLQIHSGPCEKNVTIKLTEGFGWTLVKTPYIDEIEEGFSSAQISLLNDSLVANYMDTKDIYSEGGIKTGAEALSELHGSVTFGQWSDNDLVEFNCPAWLYDGLDVDGETLLAATTISGITKITNTTNTTATTDGALVVAGGVGVGGSLRVGQSAYFGSSITSSGSIMATSTTAEVDVGVDGPSGKLYLFSQTLNSDTGEPRNRGLYTFSSSGASASVLTINANNNLIIGNNGNIFINKWVNIGGTEAAMGHLAPTENRGAHLGLASYRWGSLYLDGQVHLQGSILFEDADSYGDELPSSGTTGQIFFKII